MGTNKKTATEETEETALAVQGAFDDLMGAADTALEVSDDEAGMGSEDIGLNDIILPRVVLLQALSKAVTSDLPGAKPGVWWLTPHNRPVTLTGAKVEDRFKSMRFAVVKIHPSQRRWTPLDQGGGIECEAPDGTLTARAPNGLAGAKATVNTAGAKMQVEWDGGHATDKCFECVFGPGAAAAAVGKPASPKSGNPWLPKMINGIKVDDAARAPRCTTSIDALVFVALPPFKDEASGIDLPPDVIPAFITFSRTAHPAGKSLAAMIKMDGRSPAWAKLYTSDTKKVDGEKGVYFTPSVAVFGATRPELATKCRELYESSREKTYVPDLESEPDGSVNPASSGGEDVGAPPRDDAAAPNDNF